MTKYVIRCWGFANGEPCSYEGQYIKSFDHEAYNGRGYAEFTPNPTLALSFDSRLEAIEFWQRESRLKPMRPDGKPNRPMTGMHAEMIPLLKQP